LITYRAAFAHGALSNYAQKKKLNLFLYDCDNNYIRTLDGRGDIFSAERTLPWVQRFYGELGFHQSDECDIHHTDSQFIIRDRYVRITLFQGRDPA